METIDGLARSFFGLAALGFWAATALFHLKFSLMIVTPVSTPLGPLRIADYAGHVSWVAFVGLVIYLAIISTYGHNRKITFSCWAAWSVIVFGTNHFFVSSANEYIHYPQYAILAGLLVPVFDRRRTGAGMVSILFWATFLGIVDEMNQYFYLCPQYGDYLDFNDFFLNELGAMAGILLLYGFREKRPALPSNRPFWRTKEARVTVIIACGVLLLAFSGRLRVSAPFDLPPGGVHRVAGNLEVFLERKPGMYGSWQKGNPSGFYYVLGPFAGGVLLFSAGAVFLLFEERRRTRWVQFFRSLAITARDGTIKRHTRREDLDESDRLHPHARLVNPGSAADFHYEGELLSTDDVG